jgi:hypothetical protein
MVIVTIGLSPAVRLYDTRRPIPVAAREMVEFARAVVVNDDSQSIAAQSLHLKLSAHAGKI